MDWLRFPPLSALRAFAALAEAGSAVQAGKLLNVSHAAISQQLRQLEDRLGVALVERGGRSLRLTEDGSRLADAVLKGFAEMEQVIAEVTGRDDDRPLQLSLTPTFASNWLMPRLVGYRRRHPETEILLNPTPQLVKLTPGGIDVAIRYGRGDWPGVDVELMFLTPQVVVASPELVGDREFRHKSELAEFPWLQELGTTESSDWLRRNGATHLKGVGWIDVPGNLLLEGARTGQGVMVTARHFAEEDIQAGRLRLLFEEDYDKGYFLVTRPGVQRPLVKEFRKWLLREVADQEEKDKSKM